MNEKSNSEKLLENLEETFARLADDREKALIGLKDLQSISQALYQHEKTRLTRKYGTENPRSQQLQARITQNANLVKEIESEIEVASIKVPKIKENEGLIQRKRNSIESFTEFI